MIRARFNFNPKTVAARIRQDVVTVQKRIALQLLDGFVNMTPVDTGRARGNWQVTIGSPSLSVHENRYDKDGGPTISTGSATIQSLSTLGAIYLTNNLPYILALENGSSQRQAPAGMVQVTLDRVASQYE